MNKKDFIITISMFIISLFINLIMLYFAMDASSSARHSEDIAQESLNELKNSTNHTLEYLRWYEEPRPLVTYSSNMDYVNKRVDMNIFPNLNGFGKPFYSDFTVIKVTLYNSGRAPLVSPKLFLNLTADNISNIFPFKIYRIVTPQEKMYYNDTYHRFLFSWDDVPGNDNYIMNFIGEELGIGWVKTAKIEKIDDGKVIRVSSENDSLSLRLNDEKTKLNVKISDGRIYEFTVKPENGKLNIYPGTIVRSYVIENLDFSTPDIEFPPHYQNGLVYYYNMVSYAKNPENPPLGTSFATASYQAQKDIFGPFRIGTIEPGKLAEFEIWLFAIAEKKGNLQLIIEPQERQINYSSNISIDFSLSACNSC